MQIWEEIAAALPVRAVVEASAGTGKTYTIEHCVVELIRAGVPVSRILLVTFTEKAAMELRARVREKLAVEATLARENGVLSPLQEALSQFDSALVTTLHGFAQRALTWFALYTPYPYRQEVAGLSEILPDVVRNIARSPLEGAAAYALERMAAERKNFQDVVDIFLDCIEKPVPLRFSGEAAGLRDFLGGKPDWRGAFSEVFDLSGMKDHAEWETRLETFFGAPHWLAALQGIGAVHGNTLKSFVKKCEAVLGRLSPGSRKVVQPFLLFLPAVRMLHGAPLHAACLELVPLVQQELEREKRARRVMTYNDMLQRLALALEDPLSGPRLAAKLQQFTVGIVDEFQDTDEWQWRILRKVFLENPQGSLVVVGDPKQAIYRFRGADIFTYQQAVEELKQGGARVYRLDANYRCTPGMVDAINDFFGGNGPDSFFRMQGVQYETPLSCGKPGMRLQPPLPPVVFAGQVYCAHVSKERRRHLLADQAAREILRIVEGGFRLEELDAKGEILQSRTLRFEDILFLVPRHSDGRLVAGHFRQAGIPYTFYKRQTLFSGPEALALQHVLEAVLHPDRPAVRHKAFITPFFGFFVQEIAQAGTVPPDHPAVQFLLDLHEAALQGRAMEVLDGLERKTGLYRRLLSNPATRRDAVNLERIFSILRHLVQTRQWTLPQVAQTLRKWAQRPEAAPEFSDLMMEVTDPDENAVRILTMHNAKGLEAPVVFLYGGFSRPVKTPVQMYRSPQEGRRVLFVGSLSKNKDEKACLEEEEDGDAERLMYVAMTRAKAYCYAQIYADTLEEAPAAPGGEETGGVAAGKGQKPARHLNRRVQERAAQIDVQNPQYGEIRENAVCLECRKDSRFSGEFSPLSPARPAEPAPGKTPPEWREETVDPGRWWRRQWALFSYSSLKGHGVVQADEPEEWSFDTVPEAPPGEPPPGTHTGLALHALCETADLAQLRAAPDAKAWMQPLEGEIRRELRRQDLDEALWERFGQMVYAAYATPVNTAELHLPPLCEAAAVAREAEFRMPWDEALQRRLRRVFHFVPEKHGHVMGYFDALVELDGRLWLVDWKTDMLPDYGAQTIEAHVASHYALQAMIYEEVVTRLLRKNPASPPYGGFLYVFVRGFSPAGGVVALPPGAYDR